MDNDMRVPGYLTQVVEGGIEEGRLCRHQSDRAGGIAGR